MQYTLLISGKTKQQTFTFLEGLNNGFDFFMGGGYF